MEYKECLCNFDPTEQYEYFCAISRYLYGELDKAIAMSYLLSHQGIDNGEWEQRKSYLLHKIELHLHGFDMAVFEKYDNDR